MNPKNSHDVTDRHIIQEDTEVICRRKLDVERGNYSWLCECPLCRIKKEKIKEENECKTDTVSVDVEKKPNL